MNKQQLEELERTNELKCTVWGKALLNELLQKTNPHEITSESIESNLGRISKAIRLLGNNVRYIGERVIKESWGNSRKTYYQVQNIEDSRQYEEVPTFPTDLPTVHDNIFDFSPSSQFDMDTVAYRSISSLTRKETIYVYWHQNEFDIVSGEPDVRLYPKALLDTRFKLIMRSMVEQFFHSNFHTRIESYLGLPEESIKMEDHFKLEIRNFAAHGHRFSLEKYFGTNGFMEEYTHFRDYFQALINKMNDFRTVIQAAGGHVAITEKYRKDIITFLKRSAPLHAFQTTVDRDDSIDKTFKNPFLNSFILRNAQYLDYDTLYSNDKNILFINESNTCTSRKGRRLIGEDTAFIPDPKELELINTEALSCTPDDLNTEAVQCTLQMI